MEDFISLFPRMSCYQKYFETVNKKHLKCIISFLLFHNTKFYVIPFVVYRMKWNLLTSLLISWSFIFLEIVYILFHLNETLLFIIFFANILFINSLSYHKKILRGAHLLKMKLSLGVTLYTINIWVHCFLCLVQLVK
jgi:hypothetical protein